MYAPDSADTADAMDEASSGVAIVDTSKPSIARVYDYLLGGKDNFAADREEAARLLAIYPEMPKRARENRLFLERAVSWLAGRGIRQFLDIGSGLPTAQNTHQVAQRVNPSCRVVYVDADPVVVAHGRALLAGNGVAVMQGDARDRVGILTSPALRSLIDLRQPVAIILTMILHFFDVDTATQLMVTFGEWLAPDSYVVLSVGCGDEKTGGRLAREYKAGTLYNHTPEQIAGFFDGLALVGPGLVDARDWKPTANTVQSAEYTDGRILAGVGKKAGALWPGTRRARAAPVARPRTRASSTLPEGLVDPPRGARQAAQRLASAVIFRYDDMCGGEFLSQLIRKAIIAPGHPGKARRHCLLVTV